MLDGPHQALTPGLRHPPSHPRLVVTGRDWVVGEKPDQGHFQLAGIEHEVVEVLAGSAFLRAIDGVLGQADGEAEGLLGHVAVLSQSAEPAANLDALGDDPGLGLRHS